MSSDLTAATAHGWRFFRTGEFDQVRLQTSDDLRHLGQLDQKLWVALSCPVKGLELDEKTLALIDLDHDGHVRVPEILEAVRWADQRLKRLEDLLAGLPALPLAAINDATPEGRMLVTSARQVLASLGRPEVEAVRPEDLAEPAKILGVFPLNGDGVIPAAAATEDEVKALIAEIVSQVGGVRDHTGELGVTAEKMDQFFAELDRFAARANQRSAADVAMLGERTAAGYAAMQAVRAKADDYFARSRLAAFDLRAQAALNRHESDYLALAAKDLSITAAEIAAFPLARIEAGRPLPLVGDVNPAWAQALATFQAGVVAPLLGAEKNSLTEDEWITIKTRFSPYEAWWNEAGAIVRNLGVTRVNAILTSQARERLAALIAKDQALASVFKAVAEVEQLARYHRDLAMLLRNFVNFADFYSGDRFAVFQAGVLYLDRRSCELCLRVEDPAVHAVLATMSNAYVAYLECRRDGAVMKIAAGFTQGDSDYLFVGRNGLFYDRAGRDWDATIVKTIDNAISVRQAFWSPYKKVIRMIEDQVAKRASAADAATTTRLQGAAVGATAKPPPPPQKIDIGTVAALGVGVGAISTFFATVFAKFVDLPAWQIPLVIAAIVLLISVPSMLIAWLKLRQRNIGPLLEANGWAINGRVKITVPFGCALTNRAELPPGARCTLHDPYASRWPRRMVFLGLGLLLGASLVVAKRYGTWPFAASANELQSIPAKNSVR